jgi:hypothetical protein
MNDRNTIAKALADRVGHLTDVVESRYQISDKITIPSPILRILEESLLSGETHYTVRPGMPELRRRIAQEIGRLGGPRYDSVDNVLITNGDSESLFVTLLGMRFHPGKVLATSDHARHRQLFGLFDLEVLGALPEETPVPELRLLYRGWNSNSATQEAFTRLAVDRELPDFLNLEDALGSNRAIKIPPFSLERTLIAGNLDSFQGLPAFRLGYLLGPDAFLRRIRVWKQAISICSAAPSQRAAVAALTVWQKEAM